MNLFNFGDFTLASGLRSRFKIDCDALTDDDWAAVAAMFVKLVKPFGQVEGVPRGGLKLEEAMWPYATAGGLLVVDDVWTSGGSIQRHLAGREAAVAVLFARNPTPPGVVALFRMTPEVQS